MSASAGLKSVNSWLIASKVAQRVRAGAVEQVDQHATAFDVAQEFQPQPDAFVRAFEQAGNIDQHHLAMIDLGDAQRRLDGGEGIVGDLGLAALTTLSSVDLPALGTPMMPTSATSFSSSSIQASSPGSPFSARRGAVLRAVLKAALPRPPRPPLGDDHFLPRVGQVGQHLAGVGVAHDGAGRHGDAQVGASGARAVSAAAVSAKLCAMVDAVLQVVEGVQPRIDHEGHTAATPAVAAVGAAARDIFLFAEGNDAVAAAACFYIDSCAIIKHVCIVREMGRRW